MIGFHCIGMCGPLIMAFRFGSDGGPARRMLSASSQLLCYQSGRLLVYLLAGALVGWLGYTLQMQLRWTANLLSLITAVIFIGLGLAHLGLLGTAARQSRGEPRWMLAAMRQILDRWRGRAHARAFALGVVMGFLPCMLVFWCLGLAASRAHPLDGALLMGLLVLMTTPVLLLAAIAPMSVHRWQAALRDRVSPIALIFSGLWLGLIGLAANGYIAHLHLQLGPFTVMFW
ncbi:MAG: sulfite exporter TauE/SafE family protein [Planctomycetota bacterium]|nr:MAG: sulfite exporter TauE/SafE family protein [Planctomycetota bacterium]